MKKEKISTILIGIICLLVGVSFSYAFFSFNSNTGVSTGNEVSGNTNKTPETTFKSEELLKPNNTNIYPGHKSIAAIKVTAQGVNDVSYDLTWNGTNTLGNYNYTIYKTTTEERPNFNCQVKTKSIENVGNVYYEECNGDLSKLGEAIDSGVIEKSSEITTIKILENQLMNATSEGNTIYYYLVLEFPNIEEAQEGQGGKFEGVFNAIKNDYESDLSIMAVYLEQDDGTFKSSQDIPTKIAGYGLNTKKSTCSNGAIPEWDYDRWRLITNNITKGGTSCNLYFSKGSTMDEILANYNTSTRSDFSTIYVDENSKTVFMVEDGLGTSKYFAGAPTDNYVKFGGFYWRIIRMNGDKTTRLIYAGNAHVIDMLSNKKEVLANGYSGSINYTNALANVNFGIYSNDNVFVGFKYALGNSHGINEKSIILNKLDTWYETYLKVSYGKYIDGSTGFCGDRTAYTDKIGTTTGGGAGTINTYYGDYVRLLTNKSPVLECANINDLYTISGSNRGNESLVNPVGLITADEVAYAGGVFEKVNLGYYLKGFSVYWTMSPFCFETHAYVLGVSGNGKISSHNVSDSNGVRPVINLSSNTRFTGTGTWDDPFQVVA